jgi:hypothetical protein
MSSPLLRISRQLLPSEHQALRNHIPEINRLGDLGIYWRKLGETGVTLVERGQYQRLIEREQSQLARQSVGAVAAQCREGVLPGMPTRNQRLTAPVTAIDFLGEGPMWSIAYILESPMLHAERSHLTEQLNKLNGINTYWEDFEPHITLATIPAGNASDKILDAFDAFAPEKVTLLSATAKAV